MIIILLVHFLFFWLHNDLFWKSHRFHIIFHSKRSLERWSNTYPYMYNQKSFFMWSNRFKNGSYASTTVFPKLRNITLYLAQNFRNFIYIGSVNYLGCPRFCQKFKIQKVTSLRFWIGSNDFQKVQKLQNLCML